MVHTDTGIDNLKQHTKCVRRFSTDPKCKAHNRIPISLARVQEKYARYESSIHFMFVTTQRYSVDLFEPLNSHKNELHLYVFTVCLHILKAMNRRSLWMSFVLFCFFAIYEFRFI